MAPPISISTPESFIESLTTRLASLAPPLHHSQSSDGLASSPSSRPAPPFDLSTLSTSAPSQAFSTLLSTLPKRIQEEITHLLTTLHFLFPHELIPALDLLDRRLVMRMVIEPSPPPPPSFTTAQAATAETASNAEAGLEQETDWSDGAVRHRVTNAPMPVTRDGVEIRVTPQTSTTADSENEIFYVRSAAFQTTTMTGTSATARRRRHHANESKHYEVRLSAWNCTCPVFAVSALGQSSSTVDSNAGADGDHGEHDVEDGDNGDYNEQREPVHQPHPATRGSESVDLPDLGLNVNPKWRFGGTLTCRRQPRPPSASARAAAAAAATVAVPICKHILAVVVGKHVPDLFGSGVRLCAVGPEEAAGWAGGWGD